MRYILNVAYLLALLIVSPWLVYAAVRYGKYRDGIAQKFFGLSPKLEEAENRIWFHAVSVGEVNLLAPIIERILRLEPNAQIVISTTTKTGFQLATQKYPQHLTFYCPIDFTWAVRNAMTRIKPDLLVLVELELWPNLICEAGRRDVPVAIMNARLSDNSFRGYRRLGPLMRNWMSNIRLVAAQSPTCAERFVQLGVPTDRVRAVGSVKFDGAFTDRTNAKTTALRGLADIAEEDIVFVAGSTQSPEESMAIDVWKRLVVEFPKFRLILVPRHPERYDEVIQLLDESGVPWVARSQLAENPGRAPVLLVDTVGELGGWWGTAQIGFVGGSMGPRGGQNMIEPSAYGVATCFGPNTKNFRDVVKLLLDSDAARVVHSEEDLEQFVRRCLVDPTFRHELGQRAKQLVLAQRGAADQTTELLLGQLDRPTAGRINAAA